MWRLTAAGWVRRHSIGFALSIKTSVKLRTTIRRSDTRFNPFVIQLLDLHIRLAYEWIHALTRL